ncbi:MAG: carboxypeptidase regulatory-like domain-containing protein [Bryobacterales bacterium]|nr:carboxypeptidase regulatory-like domain-containing protein [Bryobacterales bacterium]
MNLFGKTLLLSSFLTALSFGQNVTGNIVGTVRDASGAIVPTANVSVSNDGTGIETKAQANTAGDFTVPGLAAGTYTVRVEATGFRPSQAKGLVLLPNRSLRQDFTLEVGTVQQVVEVSAAPPVLNTENATIGNVMQSQQIVTMPLNGRFLDRLIRISAGVTTDSASNPRVAGSSYWGGMSFNVDGVAFNDPGNGGGAYSFRHGMSTLPSVDAVSEFKMDSNSQKAEFEGAASVTIATKSGTNNYHGTLFYFNRNKATTARNFFALTNPPFNRNEFGGMIGGPIVKNRTFFFGGYESLLERSPRTFTLSVATAAMRAGNFAGLNNLIDPLSGTPFANNVIPTSRIDSRAKALIDRVALPNAPGQGAVGTLNNHITNIKNDSDIDRYFVRLDHKLTDRDSLSFTGNISKANPYFVAQAYPEGYGSWENGGNDTRVGNFTWTRNISPSILNELRVGYTYHGPVRQGMNRDFDPRTLFPDLYGPLPLGGLPSANILGHVSIGDYGGSERGKQLTRQIIDNFTIIRGRHTFKTGFDFGNFRMSSPPGAFGLGTGVANNAALGRFDFNGRFTNDTTGAAQPAHGFADFLLGYANFTYRSTPTAVNLFYNTRYSAYAQDDWQVNSRFTLSYGVRYMLQTTWKERDLAQANFDFASGKLIIPRSSLPPQAQQRLFSSYPIALDENYSILSADTNNFAPRVGFAYRPFAGNKTVVRGGFGIYYNFLPVFIGFRQMGFSNPPFLLAETFESTPGRTPSLTLARPFPGGGAISPNPAITIVENNIRNSASQQWNMTLERELVSNIGLRVSYVGNKTSHLPFYNYNMNLPAVQRAGTIQGQRPFQPWADILMLKGAGDSTIHQLQIEAIRRYSNGLSLQVEYSWNRSLDNTPIVGGPQNPYNTSNDRGNSDQVRRHIFTTAYTYELPFGPGKKFATAGGAAGKIVGGWQVSGITYLRTGQPFSVGFNATQPGWFANRADVARVGNLSRSERNITRWFDASGYTAPAPFTFGNSARNLLFGPGDIVFDVSVIKDTMINERIKTQFRAEFFNMPNHANFGNPGANISVAASLGRITSAGDPRQIQFGLKLVF